MYYGNNTFIVTQWEEKNMCGGETLAGITKSIKRYGFAQKLFAFVIVAMFVFAIIILFMYSFHKIGSFDIVRLIIITTGVLACLPVLGSQYASYRIVSLEKKRTEFVTYGASFVDPLSLFSSSLSEVGLREKVREALIASAVDVLVAERKRDDEITIRGKVSPAIKILEQSVRDCRAHYDLILMEGVRLGLCQTIETKNHFAWAEVRIPKPIFV